MGTFIKDLCIVRLASNLCKYISRICSPTNSTNMSSQDSKIVSMGNDELGNIVIDINTRVVLDSHIASRLRIDTEDEFKGKQDEGLDLASGDSDSDVPLPKEDDAIDLPGQQAISEEKEPSAEGIGRMLSDGSEKKGKIWGVLSLIFLLAMVLSMIVIVLDCFCGELPKLTLPNFSLPNLCSLPVIGIVCCIFSCLTDA